MLKMVKFLMILMLMVFVLILLIKNKFKNYKYKQFFNNIECGFNNFIIKSFKISLNFFIIMIIFIIFDLEMSLIMPMVMNIKTKKMNYQMLMLCMFLLFMVISMLYEIKFKSIMWK